MEKVRTHKDLILWKKGVEFVTAIYEVTALFPKTEIYGITNQLRRAAVSIPSNIAEGSGRRSSKELIQFLHVTLGSISEVDTQLLIAKNLKYIHEDAYLKLTNDLTELSKMTTALIRILSSHP